MCIRELQIQEWGRFFDCFTRAHRRQRVCVDVREPGATARPLAAKVPLLGITLESGGEVDCRIRILVGEEPGAHAVHCVRHPTRVRIGQVSNGADEVLVIDSEAGPTTIVDFRPEGKLGTGLRVADRTPDLLGGK